MLSLRHAAPEDLPAVQALWRANPMGGPVRYYHDAPPSWPGQTLHLIEWEGRLAGTLSLRTETIGGHRTLYVGSVVVDQPRRGARLSARALQQALAEASSDDLEFLTLAHARDNPRARGILKGDGVRVVQELAFGLYHLPAIPHRAPEVSTDYDEACGLINAFYGRHAFFTPVRPEDLAARPHFRLLVKRKRGAIVACTGLSKQRPLRKMMLVAPPLHIRLAMGLSSLVNGRIRPRHADGAAELVVHHLTEPAFAPGFEADLQSLLDTVGWERDAHCFQIAAHEASPLSATLRRRWAFVVNSNFVVFQARGVGRASPPSAVSGPVFHDYSRV